MLQVQSSVLNKVSINRAEYVSYCRFFNNNRVDYNKIATPLIRQTAEASSGRHVLVVQDTTELNYGHHSGLLSSKDKDLGPTGNNKDIGFFMHPSIVIDRDQELLLGASDVYLWNRRFDKQDKATRKYKAQPIEEKESYRWIARAQRSKEVLNEAASILFIADREADIFEEFIRVPDKRSHVLIRSRMNRRLYQSTEKLYEYIRSQPVAGNIELSIRKTGNRKRRDAKLTVQYAKVQICRPATHQSDSVLPEYLELYAIMATETQDTVPKGEKPISWVLLTTQFVENLQDALDMIRCYAMRWQVELVFASIKSKGVDVEASQLETGRALKSMAVMSLITALRVNQLRLARDDKSGIQASIVFTTSQLKLLKVLTQRLEGKTQKQKNPHQLNTIAWAAWVIARLGGWKGYTSESPPGNKTMYHGWKDFNRLYEGWNIAQMIE